MTDDPTTTILLVEDNPGDRRYAEELLRSSTFTVIEAETLAEALDCVKDKHVDVILLDLSLPDSERLEGLATLLLQRKELPIVVLTGLEDIQCAIEAMRSGANDYLVKKQLNAKLLSRSINDAIESKKRQRMDEAVIQRTHLSNLTAAVAQSLIHATSLSEMLRGCADAIVAHLDAALARVWTVDPHEPVLLLQASSGLTTQTDGAYARIPIGKFKVGLIASQKQPHLTNDLQQHPVLAEPEWAEKEGLVAFAGHPLLIEGRLVGVMTMFAKQPLGEVTLEGLSAVADQIALGIERSNAEDSRALLAAIVQCSEEAIFSKSLDGVILSWNEAAVGMFGYSADEMIGQNISVLMPDSGVDEFPRLMERLKRGEHIQNYETIKLCKDGRAVDVSLTLSPVKHSSGTITGASVIVRDTTERNRSDRLNFARNEVTRILSESDSLVLAAPAILQMVTKTTPAEVGTLWSIDRHGKSLRCIDVWYEHDPQLDEFAAISRHVTFPGGETLPGRVLEKGVPAWIPDLKEDKSFARRPSAAKGGLHSAMAFPILLGTQVLGVIEFFSRKSMAPEDDVSEMMAHIGAQLGLFIERRNAEEASRQSAQAQLKRGQAIMENAPIGIAWLGENLVISEANHAFCNQFGVDRDSLPGTFIFKLATGIPNEQLIAVFESGVPFTATNFPISLSGSPGARKFCDLTIWPVKDDDDRPVGLVILIVEVTERVKLAKQREDFVATLTHDLKNPLLGQDRILDLILQNHLGPLPADLAKILALLKISTGELLELIGTLLEVYRYEEGSPQLRLEKVDVKHTVRGCIAQLNPIAEAKGIEIDTTFQEALCTVSGDKIALRRVVMNLLDNAIKFTQRGGRIQVSCQSTGTTLVLSFEDSGAGISQEDLKWLFQRFAQAGKKDTGGTGLGLYLCRQIVEAHGGEITCSSELGKGTTIAVTLPGVDC